MCEYHWHSQINEYTPPLADWNSQFYCVFRNGLISISDWVFGNVWSCSTLFIMKTSHKSDGGGGGGGPQIGYLWDIGGKKNTWAQNIFVWGFWKTDLNIVEYYLIFSCRIEPFKHMNSTRNYFFLFLVRK